LDTPSYVEIR